MDFGIEHPDITAALRTGYPLDCDYDCDEDELWEESDLWEEDW